MEEEEMKIKVKLTDANEVTEERAVTLRWLLNFVSGLVKGNRSFTIVTDGGKVEYAPKMS